jgi:hypothetical protein
VTDGNRELPGSLPSAIVVPDIELGYAKIAVAHEFSGRQRLAGSDESAAHLVLKTANAWRIFEHHAAVRRSRIRLTVLAGIPTPNSAAIVAAISR